VRQFTADRSGATAVEYALIAVLISVMVVAGTTNIGTKLSSTFTSLSSHLK
jgi:pilus assembly protein Flp/PilA